MLRRKLRTGPPSGQCPKKEFLHDGWFKNPNMSSQIQDNEWWVGIIRWIQHDLSFSPERPHLSGRGPGQWLCGLRPSAIAFPLQLLPSAHKLLFMAGESLASIIGVIIIWNWSHYRRRGFSFFHRAACSCHVVLQLWSGRLQHCHIDCT